MMITLAPRPAATLAAFAPTTPPPRIRTFAGNTPATPPSKMPLHTPRPKNQNFPGQHASPAAQQNAPALLRAFEKLGPLLDAHAARHFAHRRQERQSAVYRPNRFIRNRRGPRGQHGLRQRAI